MQLHNKIFKTVDTKYIKPTILFLCAIPIISFAAQEHSPQIRKPLSYFVSPTSDQEHDLFQQCATDICGPVNQDPFGSYSEYLNFFRDNEKFNNKTVTVDPEISSKFNKEVRPIIIEAINNIKNILNTLKNTLQGLNSGHNESEWDEIGKEIALYYTTDWLANLPSRNEGHDTNMVAPESESDYQSRAFFTNKLKQSKSPETTSFCSETICKNMVKEELLDLQQTLKQSVQPAENNTNQYLKYCESVYAIAITQDQQIKAYKESLEQYKNRFLNIVFADYSAQSREQFADYINNKLIIKTDRMDGEQQFIDSINNIATATTEDAGKEFSFMNAMKSLPKSGFICPSHIAFGKFYTSSYYIWGPRQWGTDQIYTGFISYLFPEYGKWAFAHELAHTLNE